MRTFKEMTEQEIKEFTTQQEKFVKEYKSVNKINNVLLIGIGTYCNNAVFKVGKHENISKLYVDTNRKWLEQYSNYPIIDLSKENISNKKSLWKDEDNYKKLYDEVSKYIVYFTNYDYIVICSTTDNEEYTLVAEVIADFCKEQNKKFMICHTKTYLSYMASVSGTKKFKEISDNFLSKMKEKKYITNEISNVNTSLSYDVVNFKFQEGNYKSILAVGNSEYEEINSDIFSKIVNNSIIKMLEDN